MNGMSASMQRLSWASRVALLTLSLCLLVMPAGVRAQDCRQAAGDIELTLTDLGLGTIDMFFLADFNSRINSGHPILFGFSAENLSPDESRLVLLRFNVNVSGGVIDDELIESESLPFTLGAGEIKQGTNQDLAESNSHFYLDSFDITGAGEALQDVILETGYLPEGTYIFTVSLIDTQSSDEVSCSIELHVINPRAVNLILPGDHFSDNLLLEHSLLPQFQWQSHGSQFNFRVCEVQSGDSSGEEVMESQPIYEQLAFESFFAGTHTLLYPPSAELLVEGGMYCWEVEAIINTSGGEIIFTSDIFCFELASNASVSFRDPMLAALINSLPPGTLDWILAQLPGFSATGFATIDDIEITQGELQLLLEALIADGWEIGNLEIE